MNSVLIRCNKGQVVNLKYIYLAGSSPTSPSICDRIHLMSSCTALFVTQVKFSTFSLIAFPNLASATKSCSCDSLDTNFLRSFFKGFDILPSTAAVAAPRASVVSINLAKCFNLILKEKQTNRESNYYACQ